MICVIISGNRNAGSGSTGEKMGVRYYAGGASEPAGDKDIMAPWCLQALRKNMMQIIVLPPAHQGNDKDNKKNKDKIHIGKEIK